MVDHAMFDNENWHRIPQHCRDGLQDYIESGRPVGSFLEALLSNDLKETFGRADEINRMAIFDYIMFLYNDAPRLCWGSPDRYAGWIARGGLNGLPPVQPEFDDPAHLEGERGV